jgi:cell division protein FtsQ
MTGALEGVFRLVRRPWVWAVLVVLLVGSLVGVVRYAPIFEVEQVAVVGIDQVTVDEVLQVAGVNDGEPLLTLPVETIEQRVESLDTVATARVTRDWPDGVRIVVKERHAIGYVNLANRVGLVGSDGSVYRSEPRAPGNLPQLAGLRADVGASVTARADAPSDAVFAVADTLPRELQRAVARIEADASGQVTLVLDDGVVVTWGTPGAAEQKATVIALLRERRQWGQGFSAVDVSAPDAPALAP